MGTFDDLSDEEKTRALLQFLQHHQQLEQENEAKQFQEALSPGSVLAGSQKSMLANSKFWTVFFTTASSIVIRYVVHNLDRQISNLN